MADPCDLTDAVARQRLAQDGPNEVTVSRPRSVLRLAREVASEPMFLLLAACGSIYLALGDAQEALMLLGFVFIVMGLSFVQQRRSERSLEALRDLSSPQALVRRGGAMRRIAARELVVGDMVLLSEGDRVPADMSLLDASNLAIDESLLTGESVPVTKRALASEEAMAADAWTAFSGTLVTQGTARGRVTATGARSALGRIGASLAGIAAQATPIQRETRGVVKGVAIGGLALAAALAAAYGALRGDWLQGLLAGLTLAMGIIPEELPMVLALFLGLGAWRLVREKVLARSIPAVELLGATTVLCVDKTGTLTANRMSVRQLRSGDARYDALETKGAALQEELHPLLEYAVLASHRRTFDPMESAIAEAAGQWLAGTEHLHSDWTLIDDYPLSPELLAMSRVWRSPDQRAFLIAAKGAPEAIVDLCHMDAGRAGRIAEQVLEMATDGLRVLGVACGTFDADVLPGLQHDFDFRFLGLVGLEDPVRADVPQAIAECRAAGIRVVMMTGDHPATAIAVARQAGLSAEAPVMTGVEMASLADEALAARLAATTIFCRVQPDQKLRLVRAFRAQGDVVAMTGDGVNDAPALKAADIGVAMGARGTEVAREAAALVLLNDDFASLVTAIRHGRRVFANLRKAIVFVVAVHVPIVGLSILPVVFGWPLLLMPVHILFLQLIIDPACSVVFEAEPLEESAMKVPPRRPDQRLFDSAVLVRGLWQGGVLLGMLLVTYAGARWMASLEAGRDDMARTLTFVVLVLSNLGLIQSNRSWERTAWHGNTASNRQFGWIAAGAVAVLCAVLTVPAVGRLFSFVMPSPLLLAAGLGMAVLSMLWFECIKWGLRRKVRGNASPGGAVHLPANSCSSRR
ncbi:calcium-transporting ATPase [Variovorax paradoxus B4]|uniref:Calcium-transporting ATPase n=1 Tax=Variovorax paradoxus B4 TaxID=1246301 RepID=T1XK54_VARPD|nr:cation-translocating P-type ATPase [Variovorax paradoxus]AGU52963.1 calcium-transporting ATPase [Variovorax paradoxus B4]